MIHVDVARQTDPDRLAVLQAGIEVVLEEVRAAVEDWAQMRAHSTALATELRRQAPPCEQHQLEECEAFLDWLSDDNFTYLGYREYELQQSGALVPIPGTGLGILRGTSSREPNLLSGRALDEARSSDPLVLTKANSKARVHRPSYLDYVGRQTLRRRRPRRRRAAVPRPLHGRRLPRQPADDPPPARQGRVRADAGRLPA